jgi:hypothetical protein
VDLRCNAHGPTLDGVARLADSPRDWVRTLDGELWAFDMEAGDRSLVATDVSQVRALGSSVWTIESRANGGPTAPTCCMSER